jgi:hypothetical protein
MKILLFLACCLFPGVASLAQIMPTKKQSTASSNTQNHRMPTTSRRELLLLGAALPVLLSTPSPAVAEDSTLQSLLDSLRSVPTFCIVDPQGATFMINKQGDPFAKGYAFLTFSGALAVLGDAQRAAEEGGYADLWKDATITVIPADVAVRLALQPSKRTSQKDVTARTLLDIIPGVDEREAALRIDRKLADQGKVPVFYLEDLKSADGSIPFYFNKNELLVEWNTQKGEGTTPPKPKALDLMVVFQYILRGRSEELPILHNKIVFVPSQEAVETSKELKKRGLVPYKADRMVAM